MYCCTGGSMQELDPQPGSGPLPGPVLWSLHSWNCLSVSLCESHRGCWVMCLEKGEGVLLFLLDCFFFKANDDMSLTGLESYTVFLATADAFKSSLLVQFVTTKVKPPLWDPCRSNYTWAERVLRFTSIHDSSSLIKLTFSSLLSPVKQLCLFIWNTQLWSRTLFLH